MRRTLVRCSSPPTLSRTTPAPAVDPVPRLETGAAAATGGFCGGGGEARMRWPGMAQREPVPVGGARGHGRRDHRPPGRGHQARLRGAFNCVPFLDAAHGTTDQIALKVTCAAHAMPTYNYELLHHEVMDERVEEMHDAPLKLHKCPLISTWTCWRLLVDHVMNHLLKGRRFYQTIESCHPGTVAATLMPGQCQ